MARELENAAAPAGRLRTELEQRRGRWQEHLSGLATPCLVVDLAAAEANCVLAARKAGEMGVTIRPHAKAHKTSTLLQLQLRSGNAKGVTCATAYEAFALATRGFDDILVANEIVSRAGVDRLVDASEAGARLVVAVDSVAGVEQAAKAARRSGCPMGVLLDIDVGSGRCGLPPASPRLLSIVEAIAAADDLVFAGLMGYSGRANYAPREERVAVAEDIRQCLRVAGERVSAAGLAAETVSGGGTGLWDLDQGLTELQLGSYVLMEGRYDSVGLPFGCALFCAATVVSSTRDGHAVLDCGWKAISGEYGLPIGPPWLTPLSLGDEHLICEVDPSVKARPGDVVLLAPAHLDPTVNLHQRLAVIADGEIDEWEVDLRRSGPLTR